MAIKRNYKKSYGRKRRRVYRGIRRASTRRIARRAYKGVKRINRLIETKFGETGSITSVGTTPYVINITNIAVGTSPSNRIANEISVSSLCIKFCIQTAATVTDDKTNLVRILVLIDKDNFMAGSYSHAAYLQNTGNPLFSYINMANRKKFKVLHDKLYRIDALSNPQQYITKKFKLRRKVQWDNTGASTVSTIKKNNIMVVYFSDSAASPDPVVSMEYKLYWQDL